LIRKKRSGSAFAREISREIAVLTLVPFKDLAHLGSNGYCEGSEGKEQVL